MTKTNSNISTLDQVRKIMQKRIKVTEAKVGRNFTVTIQREATIMDATRKNGELVESVSEPGTVLQKAIFNTKANSELAYNNKLTHAMLAKGIACEKAGDIDGAKEAYNDYLNATQFSFNILLNNDAARKLVSKLQRGVEVTGRVEKVTTDNGSLLTFEQGTVYFEEPERGANTVFDADAILKQFASKESGDTKAPETPVTETVTEDVETP